MAKRKIKKTTKTTVVEEVVEINEQTEFACILDRSGSMGTIIHDSIGGFNSFLEQQRKESDDNLISITFFDDRYEQFVVSKPLSEVSDVTYENWQPRGLTALYDAIGRTINTIKSERSKMDESEIPSKTLVVIVTDGMENASQEYTADSVKSLIEEAESEGWQFIYLAANQDAFDVGRTFGIKQGNSFTYTADAAGASNAFNVATDAALYYTSLNVNSTTFEADSENLIKNTVDGEE